MLWGCAAALGLAVVATAIVRLGHIALQNGGSSQSIVQHTGVMSFGPTVAPATASAPEIVRSVRMSQTNDDWVEQLRKPEFWAKRRIGGSTKPANVVVSWPRDWGPRNGATRQDTQRWFSPAGKEEEAENVGESYRTVCVRTCDGFFWPISFSTTSDYFERDQKTCENSCSGQARLFVYKSPGSEPDDMEDLKGVPYKKLSTAFLFRTKYDAQCKCQPHPWEEASRDRHRLYALEAAKLKGVKVASKDIEALKDKLEKAEKIARVEATKMQETLAAQAHGAKLATAKKKSSSPVAETARPQVVTATAAEAPSPLDPAFRTGKIKAGAQAADLMGPPAPATVAAARVAKVTAASTSGAPRSDALKGAVILRLGANPAAGPARSQKSVITFPPIINRRPAPISGENWRKSAFQPSG